MYFKIFSTKIDVFITVSSPNHERSLRFRDQHLFVTKWRSHGFLDYLVWLSPFLKTHSGHVIQLQDKYHRYLFFRIPTGAEWYNPSVILSLQILKQEGA